MTTLNGVVLRNELAYHVSQHVNKIVIYAIGGMWTYETMSGVFYSDDFYLTEVAHSEGSLALPTICSRTQELTLGIKRRWDSPYSNRWFRKGLCITL